MTPYNESSLRFTLYLLRFEFLARESISFPQGHAANILRGALGAIFRKIACAPLCPGAHRCGLRDSCPYACVFEPIGSGDGPSGLADWPRPFVFRARHLDGKTIETDEPFYFDLTLFSLDHDVLGYFVRAFAALAREGLGPRRGRAALQRVVSNGQTLYDGTTEVIAATVEPSSIGLAPAVGAVRKIRVSFLTPTELKHASGIADRPEFPILFARVRDRIATLSRLYGRNPLTIDYLGTKERATAVRMTNCRVERHQTERRSSKTGQSHLIGGFVGEAEYEGDLTEFVPFLEAGRWVGVGRQSVWGKGEILTEVLA